MVHTQLHLDLGSSSSSPGLGRVALRELLSGAGWPVARVEDAALVITELIANAVTHGGGLAGVIVDLDGERLRVAVADRSHREPRRRAPGLDGGRGLLLVSHLADRWGVEGQPTLAAVKHVWFELARHEPDAADPQERS